MNEPDGDDAGRDDRRRHDLGFASKLVGPVAHDLNLAALPEPGAGDRPVRLSTAMTRESFVPMKIRVAQAAPAGASGSRHALTPRQLYW